MRPAQLKLVQALADLIIPLLGFFWWNWSFYFILLFFVLDYLVFCVFSFIKVKKINTYHNVKADFPVLNVALSVLLIAAGFAAILLALYAINPGFNVAKETWAFLAYEDLGIAQGIVLLPLLVYGGYMQYKMQFLLTGKYTVAQPAEIWKIHFMTILLVLAASGLFLGISLLVVFPEIVYTLALTFGVVLYRFVYSR